MLEVYLCFGNLPRASFINKKWRRNSVSQKKYKKYPTAWTRVEFFPLNFNSDKKKHHTLLIRFIVLEPCGGGVSK